jgi:hypothetical protein
LRWCFLCPLPGLPPSGMKTYGLTESVTGASASASRCLPTPKKLASGGAAGQSRGTEVRRPREGACLGPFKNKVGHKTHGIRTWSSFGWCGRCTGSYTGCPLSSVLCPLSSAEGGAFCILHFAFSAGRSPASAAAQGGGATPPSAFVDLMGLKWASEATRGGRCASCWLFAARAQAQKKQAKQARLGLCTCIDMCSVLAELAE